MKAFCLYCFGGGLCFILTPNHLKLHNFSCRIECLDRSSLFLPCKLFSMQKSTFLLWESWICHWIWKHNLVLLWCASIFTNHCHVQSPGAAWRSTVFMLTGFLNEIFLSALICPVLDPTMCNHCLSLLLAISRRRWRGDCVTCPTTSHTVSILTYVARSLRRIRFYSLLFSVLIYWRK